MTVFDHLPHTAGTRRAAARTSLLLAAVLAVTTLIGALPLVAVDLPARIGDEEFWQIVSDFSEPNGTFPSNNYVSNEVEYQAVIPTLLDAIPAGGVYVGVGPDQNFSYVAALRPAVAFIVDIRRQNLLQHLLYKALIEISPDRETFVAKLFSRPMAPGDPPRTSARDILDAAAARAPDERTYGRNLIEVFQRLKHVHGFGITPDDQQVIDSVYSAFFTHGPEITYAPHTSGITRQSNWFRPITHFPSYADLVTLADPDGVNRSYLGSEDAYATLRDMQLRNLIIPIVGNFAGDKALRAVGDWVRAHEAVVTTLYTSNVEQYLFQNSVWRQYYENVASMPTSERSLFIRAHFPTPAYLGGGMAIVVGPDGRRIPVPAPRLQHGFVQSSTLLDPVQELLAAVANGEIAAYQDVIRRSK